MTEVKRPKSTSTEEKKEKNSRWRQLAETNTADRQMEVILARLLSFTSRVVDVDEVVNSLLSAGVKQVARYSRLR